MKHRPHHFALPLPARVDVLLHRLDDLVVFSRILIQWHVYMLRVNRQLREWPNVEKDRRSRTASDHRSKRDAQANYWRSEIQQNLSQVHLAGNAQPAQMDGGAFRRRVRILPLEIMPPAAALCGVPIDGAHDRFETPFSAASGAMATRVESTGNCPQAMATDRCLRIAARAAYSLGSGSIWTPSTDNR